MSRTLIILATLFLFASCMDSAGRKGRPLVKDFSVQTDESSCYLVYTDWINGTLLNYTHACQTACPSGTRIATSAEQTSVITAQTSAADKDNARTVLNAVKELCVTETVARPTNQILINTDFCACLNGKPDIINNCDAYCAKQTSTSQSTLYVNTTMGSEVANHPKLGNLYNWCKVELNASDGAPGCMLELYSSAGTQNLNVSLTEGSNSFSVNINNLTKDVTYVATLVEQNSKARSKSFNLYRTTTATDTDTNVPLKLRAASLYTCIKKSGSSNTSGTINNTDQAIRVHYYFADNKAPSSLPAGDPFLICHDSQQYGANDSPLYPRLELIPNSFTVWSEADMRFSDLDQNGVMDINDLIKSRLANEYGVDVTTAYPKGLNIFGEFRWPNGPSITSGTSSTNTTNTTAARIGYFMQPWIDKTTQRAFCPKEQHYINGPDPIFKVLKNVIGVPTEAVYLAERQALQLMTTSASGTVTYEAAPQDVLIIRETLLKSIWFYRENGKNIPADELTANQKTIMFYWPVKPGTDPLTGQSDQVIYTIKAPTDIGTQQSSNTSGTLSTVFNPPDKRFGCIPSSGN